MKYARIVNAEYNSEDDLITFIAKWEKWCPDNMPPAASRHIVKTGPTSTLLMAVYETEEIAQTAGALGNKYVPMLRYMSIAKICVLRCNPTLRCVPNANICVQC